MFSDRAHPLPDHFSYLMERVVQFKDKDAFGTLFSYYGPRVKAYLLRFCNDDALAEELAQDAMVTVWRQAELFDPKQASVSTWLFRIARKIRSDANGHSKHPKLDLTEALHLQSEYVAAESLISGAQRDRLVRQAMVDLSGEQKALLRQAFYDGLSHHEIAKKSGLSLGTVKSRLRLAFSTLCAKSDA